MYSYIGDRWALIANIVFSKQLRLSTDENILNSLISENKCNLSNGDFSNYSNWLNTFISGDAVRHVWTFFLETDTGTLSFGNYHTGVKIKALLNDKAIAEATSLQRKETSFNYFVGDVLKIGEYNTTLWK